MDDNRRFIHGAERIAASVDVNSTSDEIVAAASRISIQVEYFYDNLAIRAARHLLPSGTGFRTA